MVISLQKAKVLFDSQQFRIFVSFKFHETYEILRRERPETKDFSRKFSPARVQQKLYFPTVFCGTVPSDGKNVLHVSSSYARTVSANLPEYSFFAAGVGEAVHYVKDDAKKTLHSPDASSSYHGC